MLSAYGAYYKSDIIENKGCQNSKIMRKVVFQ